MTNLVHELLHLSSTVPIGSIALNVANENSDLDLCVLNEDLSQELIHKLIKFNTGRISQYEYDDSLLLHVSNLYKLPDTDIFVFKDPEKLAIVHKVMFLMERYPKVFLRIKWIRVAAFRILLRREGLLDEKPNRPIADIGTKDI